MHVQPTVIPRTRKRRSTKEHPVLPDSNRPRNLTTDKYSACVELRAAMEQALHLKDLARAFPVQPP